MSRFSDFWRKFVSKTKLPKGVFGVGKNFSTLSEESKNNNLLFDSGRNPADNYISSFFDSASQSSTYNAKTRRNLPHLTSPNLGEGQLHYSKCGRGVVVKNPPHLVSFIRNLGAGSKNPPHGSGGARGGSNSQNPNMRSLTSFEMTKGELDKKILQIQKSTKTTFKLFAPVHNYLRSKSRFYYNWHLYPKASTLHYLVLTLFVIGLAVFSNLTSFLPKAQAGSYTWSGNGGNSLWSNSANWSAGVVPTATDDITFDGSCGSNCDATIDAGFQGTVKSLTITAAYTGTITAARTFTVSTTFSQAGGTFNGGSANNTFTGDWSVTGGSFLATTSTSTFSGNITVTGTVGNLITINSAASGTTATFSEGAGKNINIQYASIKDITATGGATWVAHYSNNVSNNTGFIWAGARTISDAGGNWSATATWAEGQVPTQYDDVVATATSGNLTMDTTGNCRSFDFTGYVGKLTMSVGHLQVYGDVNAITANKFGALMTFSGWSTTYNGYRILLNVGNNASIVSDLYTNGATINAILMGSSVGILNLRDNLVIGSSYGLGIANGIFNTNNFSMNIGNFYSSYASTRTINLGSSNITLTGTGTVWDTNTVTGLTMDPGTSLITISGSDPWLYSGGKTFNDVIFSGSGSVRLWSKSGHFNNLTFSGPSGIIINFGDPVVTGLLTLSGNSTTNRLLVSNYNLGILSTINAANISASNVDFRDITFAGTMNVTSAISIGDCGGNSGTNWSNIVTSPTTQTWNGTQGNWSDNTKWTSRVPLPQDNVVLTGTNTITGDMPRLGTDISFGGAANLTLSTDVTSYGSVNFVGSGLFTSSKIWNFESRARNGVVNITSSGATISNPRMQTTGATAVLQDDFNGSGRMYTSSGTFDANDHNVSVPSWWGNGGDVLMGSGTWTVSALGNPVAISGGTITAESSTIILSYSGSSTFNFGGGGKAYNNLVISGTGAGVLTISGSNTFNNLTVSSPRNIKLTQGTTQTINGTFTANGTSGNLATLTSDQAGSPAIISHTNPINSQWNSIQDITSTGGSWTAQYSTSVSGNTSITFPAFKRVSNAGGNFSATTTWDGGVVPTATDDIYADNASGSLTVDVLDRTVRSFDFTGYVGTLTLTKSLYANPPAGQSISCRLSPGMTIISSATTGFQLDSVAGQTTTFYSAGLNISAEIVINVNSNNTGTVLLGDDLNIVSTHGVAVFYGTFNTNNLAMNIGKFASSNSNARTINLGSSNITVTGSASVWDFSTSTGLNLSSGTSTINFTGTSAGMSPGPMTYNNVVFTGGGISAIYPNSAIFANLTFTGTNSKTNEIDLESDHTITGTLTIAGNSAVNRILVRPKNLGDVRRIIAANVVISNADFRDITGVGTANWNLSNISGGSGDCGGNSGITFTPGEKQTWNNTNGGNWSDLSWTGQSGHNRVPLPQDDVSFALAFGSSKTVTADMPRLGKTTDWTGATNTPTYNITVSTTIYGSLILISSMTMGGGGASNSISFEGRSAYDLTTAGKSFNKSIYINSAGGSYTLHGNLSSGYNFGVSSGTFSAGANNVSSAWFYSQGTAARTVNMGSGTWSTYQSSFFTLSTTGLTLNSETSTILITNGGASSFNGYGFTYYNLSIPTGPGAFTINGSNTFNNITVTAPRTVTFTSGTTQTINGTFSTNGTVGNLVTLNSSIPGSPATIAHTNPINLEWNSIRDIISTGSAWTAQYSTNVSGNTGIIFPPFKLVSSSGGNFSSSSAWSDGVVPSGTDALVAALGSGNLTIDGGVNPVVNKLVLLSGYTGTISLIHDLAVNGDVIIQGGALSPGNYTINVGGNWSKTGGTFTGGTVNLNGSNAQSILDANTTFNNLAVSNSSADGVTFADDLTVANTFIATDPNVKKITFTSGKTYSFKSLNIEGNHTNRLVLAPSSNSAWNLTDLSGTKSVSYIDISYSNASSIVGATASKNSGNNHNWNLVGMIQVSMPATGMVHSPLTTTVFLSDGTGGHLDEILGAITVSSDDGNINLSSIDSSAFTDNVWSGSIVLTGVGSRTVTFSNNTVNGIANIEIKPGVFDHFSVSTQASTNANVPLTSPVSVVAYDAYENVKIDYKGSIYFTSDDAKAVLPYTASSKYSFTLLDAGSHSFDGSGFNLKTTGSKNITVTDGSNSAVANILVNPGTLQSIEVTGFPTETVAGNLFTSNITVMAKDVAGNVKTDYAGNVWFTTTDTNGQINLPATAANKYTFTAGENMDNGVHTFLGSSFKLITANQNQTIALSNDGGLSDVVSNNITVKPASINHFGLVDYPQSGQTQWVTAGTDWSKTGDVAGSQAPYDVQVTAYDAYNNIKKDFSGPVWFSMDSGVSATLPFDSAENSYLFTSDGGNTRTTKDNLYDNGRHIFDAESFIVNTSGSSLNFYTNTSGNLKSTFPIKVKPALTASATVTFSPAIVAQDVDSELTQDVIVTVYDAAGNVKTDYTGDVYFTSTDTAATLPYTESSPYEFTAENMGSKIFTKVNTPTNYFNFHTGGQQILTAVVAAEDNSTISGNSQTVTVTPHTPSEFQATAGHQQVTLDWKNAADPAISNVNIYMSTNQDELGQKIASPSVMADNYSQYVVPNLNNGTRYYFTLRSVVSKPDHSELESVDSARIWAQPADIAARNVSAIELADGRVKIDYGLRYDSNVSVQYYDVSSSTWKDASAGAVTGAFDDQHGSSDIITHSVYWLARNDYNGKYLDTAKGFKVRIKVFVPTQGNSTAYTPSPAFTLDTMAPSHVALTVDASNDSTANLTIHAEENPGNVISMMLSNNADFSGATWQSHQTSIQNWNLDGNSTVYVKFKDSFSNETIINNKLIPIIENFTLKDNSDLRIPSYILFLSWGESSVTNVDKYIVERKTGDSQFGEVIRTNQNLYVDPNLTKGSYYSYRVKVLDKDGNISRPTEVLTSSPGLAPNITNTPQAQVFGYKQDVGVRATITWKTDQLADSFVAFSTEQLSNQMGTETTSGVEANVHGQLDRTMEHEVSVTGLLPGTKYYFKVLSQNDIKITGYSNVFEVNTPAYVTLQISDPTFTDLRPDSVWFNWQTNKASATKLTYGVDDSFNLINDDQTFNIDHKFKLDKLEPGKTYKIRVTATDEDGNLENLGQYSVTTPSNPVISDAKIKTLNNDSAVISWTTNVNTDSNVEYGETSTYGLQSGKSDMTTLHEVMIVGLQSNTLYHYKAKSKDVYSSIAESSDITFTTTSDTTPPRLTEVQAQLAQISTPQGPKYQSIVSWKTDEGATSQVEFGDNAIGQYSKKTQEDQSYNMTHVVILSDLKPNSAYSYRVVSKDKSGNETRSQNYTVITPPQEKSLVQLVINTLSDTFSWTSKLRAKWFHR